jgi:hypothetical protein
MGDKHNDLNHCTADDYNNCFTVYDDDNDEYVTFSASCPSCGIHHRLASARSGNTSGNYDRPNLDFLNNDLYYDNHDNNDAPPHNDDDYARAHNDDKSADDQHDPADYLDHFRAESDDYNNRWNNYFDNTDNDRSHYHDIAADYLFPPPDDYYKR